MSLINRSERGSIYELGVTYDGGDVFRDGDTPRFTAGQRFGEAWDLSWETELGRAYKNTEGVKTDPGYGVHNLRATCKPQRGVLEGTEVRFGLNNITDKQYTPRLSTRPATGRSFNVSVSNTF